MAYIAGFLDGDGSIMLQLKKRSDTRTGYRFMATICFYQDTRHEQTLYWIGDILEIGYISKRNDGMTELRINGFKTVSTILTEMQPYIKFKALQTFTLIEACSILSTKQLSDIQKHRIIDLVLVIQNENYVTKRKKTREELLTGFGLTP
ncbi:MAG: LAGLIDADG family homing endonuclease [Candidatus Saccharibacteria bacterium]